MIIIKTPQPDTEERLVLVHPSTIGIEDDGTFSVRAGNARDATAADLERGGYGKLPMWVTSAADGQKLIGERDEARAAFLGCAQAIGIVYQADGRADEPGPPAAVIAAIKELAKRGEERESELATANEWRERWCRESEAAAVQSNANWQRAKDLEARAEKAEGLLVQRETELRLAREDGDERARDLRQAYERAVAAAEKAERERDEALGRAQSETEWRVRAVSERQDAEVERDTLRAELARLTAPGEGSDGEPGFEHLRDCWDMAPRADASGSDVFRNGFFALYRLGVAHERARGEPAFLARLDEMIAHHKVQMDRVAVALGDEPHEGEHYEKHDMDCIVAHIKERLSPPEKGRATDEELYAIDDAHTTRRDAMRAVAARVRQERCLVAQAVGMGAECSVIKESGGSFRVTVWAPSGPSKHATRVPPADVPATLARLLGEVSRG